ncbi:hypothetical protein [Bradyrhizobium sp. Ai1a-2]|uniref:hypothetical protein n=1 Tax=Bradyrhizobium sp. Ai1a-2 TaxID=196490 RepID=UPI0004219A24|nr:hypothetical protein [Bradyrhizobium sp. Ai1a-2]
MDVGAIEIDLSQYRDRPLDEIGDDILYNAPRVWLHNPRQSEALARLEQRAQQRHAEFKREIARLHMNYHHLLPASELGNGTCETTIRRNGLGEAINLKVNGAGCFLIRVAEWQAAVMLDLIKSRQPFRTRDGLAGLARRGWLSPRYASLRDDQVQALKDRGLPFEPPVRAVELYLKQLENLGLVHSGKTETWKPAKLLWSKLQAAKELRERPARRRAEIEAIVKGKSRISQKAKRHRSTSMRGSQAHCPAAMDRSLMPFVAKKPPGRPCVAASRTSGPTSDFPREATCNSLACPAPAS